MKRLSILIAVLLAVGGAPRTVRSADSPPEGGGPVAFDEFLAVEGAAEGDRFGAAVDVVGDVDGDDVPDFVVGAPGADHADIGTDCGSVTLFSGADRSVIRVHYGEFAGINLGRSVAGTGDLNGDGVPDFVAGACPGSNTHGYAYVFSGADGTVLRSQAGDGSFGWSVAGVGDFSGDGVPDFAVGAPYEDTTLGLDAGTVWVFSGDTAMPGAMCRVGGDSAGDLMGWSLDGGGDVDGDGYDDVVVGIPGNNAYPGALSGTALVIHGGGGCRTDVFAHGTAANDYLGYAVAAVGDVNGDGRGDVAVGAYGYDGAGYDSNRGQVRVYGDVAGAGWTLLATFVGDLNNNFFGYAVAGAGDVDGDGRDDVIVGSPGRDSPWTDTGRAWVFSVLDGTTLAAIDGQDPLGGFGTSVAGLGDVNGGGRSDLLVGADNARNAALTARVGRAYVLPGRPLVCAEAHEGLIAWLPGDGDNLDTAGDHNAAYGSVTFAPGMVGKAFEFDGAHDYLGVPHDAELDFRTSMSFSAWIRCDDVSQPRVIASKWADWVAGGGGQWSWIFKIHDDHSGRLRLEMSHGTTPDSMLDLASSAVIPVGTWTHVAFTLGGGVARIYVNGVQSAASSTTSPHAMGSISTDIVLGGVTLASTVIGQFFDGGMDEVQFYDRPLQAWEIGEQFEAFGAGLCKPPACPGPSAPPVITGPPTKTLVVEATGPFLTKVHIDLSEMLATDGCDSDPQIRPNSGAYLDAEGRRTGPIDASGDYYFRYSHNGVEEHVRFYAVDSVGFMSMTYVPYIVQIRDTTPPVISDCPVGTVYIDAHGGGHGIVPYDWRPPTALDVVFGPCGVSMMAVRRDGHRELFSPGRYLPVGDYTVTCESQDRVGNRAAQTFDVVVSPVAPLLAGCPSNAELEATGPDGAVHTWTPPTIVPRLGSYQPRIINTQPVPGTTFPLGVTQVVYVAEYATPWMPPVLQSCSFDVSVRDTTAPAVTCPPDVVVEATSPEGTVVDLPNATASDLVDGAVAIEFLPASGSAFPLGATPVTVTARDASGNASTCEFVVQVVDTTAPVLAAHGDETAEATGPGVATVTFTLPSATDLADAAPMVTADPASGSVLPLGNTPVAVTAVDASGNQSTSSFVVHVVDTTAPVLAAHGDETAEATGPGGATVTFTLPSATDLADGAPVVTAVPPSGNLFPLGDTTVEVTAVDATGNESTSSFVVHVVDTTAPVLTCPADVTVPATSSAGATATFTATASDAVDASPAVTTSPASGSVFAVGTTTVTCTATDDAGNVATCTFTVTVEGGSAAVSGAAGVLDAIGPTGNTATDAAIDSAVAYLESAGDPSLWVDATHLTASGGSGVFQDLEAAVAALEGISSPPATITSAIQTLVDLAALLAETALQDAVAAGASKTTLAKIERNIADAEAALAKGDYARAIKEFGKAWKAA